MYVFKIVGLEGTKGTGRTRGTRGRKLDFSLTSFRHDERFIKNIHMKGRRQEAGGKTNLKFPCTTA
ncbi:hypothetical protein C7B64_21280 [Merismopedia glauca CCAP 1448/3]|uniref:Uncharacterized protein n=1 Tax=Merismopedia glauca CCAP 1448/3 TaxID=1296344 RepID=A0A2T1BXX5_9CYAN|nr:hypothetical protein C7B64_21280 [Merismopedia glauca CCAP 1448/3]